MTAQHTPGPWQLAEFDLRPGVHRVRTDARNIADVFISEGVPETVANAHLVKAAPLMLEALRRVLDHVEDTDAPRVANQCTLCRSYRAMVAAAIRAATGEDA